MTTTPSPISQPPPRQGYVGICPDDMVSGRETLLKMSCEEIVEYMRSLESRRDSNTQPPEESEVRVHCRATPHVLVQAIEALSGVKDRGEYLVTKCLAHPAVTWLSTVPGLLATNKQYTDLVSLAGRHGGLSDIVEMVKTQQFQKLGDTEFEFRMALRLKAEFTARSKGLGVGVGTLVSVSMAWSLTTATDSDLLGYADDLRGVVESFQRYVRDRSFLMDAYFRIAQEHLKDAGKLPADPTAEPNTNS